MHTVRFPKPFEHAHPPVRNVNEIDVERLTFGQRAADRVAAYTAPMLMMSQNRLAARDRLEARNGNGGGSREPPQPPSVT